MHLCTVLDQDNRRLSSLYAQKLRVECKARGVSSSGSKAEMLDRIEDHDIALVVSFAPDGLDAGGNDAPDPFDYDGGDDDHDYEQNGHVDDFPAADIDEHEVRETCLESRPQPVSWIVTCAPLTGRRCESDGI